jgi:hypothetical protein
VKIWDFLTGIVEFLGIIFVITPPAVSIPRERGVASNIITLSIASDYTLVRIAA